MRAVFIWQRRLDPEPKAQAGKMPDPVETLSWPAADRYPRITNGAFTFGFPLNRETVLI